MTRRHTLLALTVSAAAVAGVSVPLIATADPATADLPDLVSEPAERPITGVHTDGRLLLRFDGFVSNRRGAGALEIRASDPDGAAPQPHSLRNVRQWTGAGSPGGAQPVPPAAGGVPRVVFEAGDGHLHYHLKDAAEYTLWTPDRAAQVAIAQKTEAGFCLEDSRRMPGQDGDPVYDSDASDFCRRLPLVMGISPGWRDLYHRDLAYQWVDVSSTPPGDYALGARVDPRDVVRESDEANPTVFRPVVVPGYRARPIDLGAPVAGTPVTVRLAADRFAGEGDPYAPAPVRFRIESIPAGTLTQDGRRLRAGDVLSDPAVVFTPASGGADAFRYSAFDPGRPGYPRDAATGAPAYPVATAATAVPQLTISGAPASLTAGLGVQLTATLSGVPGGVRWSATAGRVEADGLYVAPAAPPPGGVVTVRAAAASRPDVAAEVRIRILRAPARTAAATALCAPVPVRRPARSGGTIRLSREQMLISQRISQAAVRRVAGMERWLAAGVAARDICGGSIGADALGPGLVAVAAAGTAAAPAPARPRPVVVARARRGDPGRVALSARQLLVNQRIAQAAIRRVAALERRLDGGLTGGDVRPGAVGAGQLAGSVRVVRAAPAPLPAASAARASAPPRRAGGRVTLSVRQLRINQRIAQAAVRRANALHDHLRRGVSGADLRPGTLVADNLAPEVRP